MSDSNTPFTSGATAHIAMQRRNTTREPTWFDVAAAFDAGMKFATTHRGAAKSQIARRDEAMRGRVR